MAHRRTNRASRPIFRSCSLPEPRIPSAPKTATIQDLITRYMRQGQLSLEYRFYAGGRHEILNEAEKDSVHRDVAHWLTHILEVP